MLEKSELILLNTLIHRVYTVEPFDEMRIVCLEMLRLLIPHKMSSFYLASEEGEHVLCRPVGLHFTQEQLEQYLHSLEAIDYARYVTLSAQNIAYRETDLFSDEVRENQPYYRSRNQFENIHYAAQLCISHQNRFLGVISLYRKKDEEDFSDHDILILDLLKEHLAYRLHLEAQAGTGDAMLSKGRRKTFDASRFIARYHLTIRETEVLEKLYDGQSNEKICQDFCISSHTLKKHVLSIYKKLAISSRWELYTIEPE